MKITFADVKDAFRRLIAVHLAYMAAKATPVSDTKTMLAYLALFSAMRSDVRNCRDDTDEAGA